VLVVFFFAGEASLEAELELFFVVELAELFLAVPFVVDVEDVVVAASSFFCVWQPRKAVNVSAVIKDKTDVFIVWLSLTRVENVGASPAGQALKYPVFSFQSHQLFP